MAPKGWYSNREGEWLVSLVTAMPNDLVVELGTAWGLSASYVLCGTDARMVCVDSWDDEEVFFEFQNLVESENWGDRVTPIRMRSDVAAADWTEPIGLLHIDASHEYEDVLNDYLLWSPHIVEGGWIVFHDSQTKGVGRLLRERVWPDERWTKRTLVDSQWSARNG